MSGASKASSGAGSNVLRLVLRATNAVLIPDAPVTGSTIGSVDRRIVGGESIKPGGVLSIGVPELTALCGTTGSTEFVSSGVVNAAKPPVLDNGIGCQGVELSLDTPASGPIAAGVSKVVFENVASIPSLWEGEFADAGEVGDRGSHRARGRGRGVRCWYGCGSRPRRLLMDEGLELAFPDPSADPWCPRRDMESGERERRSRGAS